MTNEGSVGLTSLARRLRALWRALVCLGLGRGEGLGRCEGLGRSEGLGRCVRLRLYVWLRRCEALRRGLGLYHRRLGLR